MLGNAVPGLAPANNKATNSGQTLRGRSVLVLIDGIPQSTPLMNGQRDIRTIDPAVIERIEVIKGATSIYGNGSAGGIINYITKKTKTGDPAFGGASLLRGTVQPFNTSGTAGYRASQSVYGRVKKWDYVASGTIEYTGVQRDGEGQVLGQTDGLSNSYQYNAFAKLGYQINENSSLTAFYNFYSSTSHAKYITENGVYGEKPAIGIRGEDPGEPAGTPFNHNARITYSRKELFASTQLDVTAYINSFRSMNRYVASATAWYGPGQTKINSRKKGLRINLSTPFAVGGRLAEVTYGLDVLNDITDQDLVDGRVYIPNMNMVNIAPYAQLKLDLLQQLIFKGGVRYENAKVTIKDFNTIATGPGNEGSIFVTGGEIPYRGATFNAGLRYNKYEAFNPFVSFSQGFAINELGRIVRRATDSDLDSLKTDPIITNNYEAGFSSTFSIFNLTAAYFISTSKLGVELVDVGGYFMPQRLPETIRGYEIALSVTPSSVWKFGGSYAYVEGTSKNDDGSENYLNGSRIAPPMATGFVHFTPVPAFSLQLFWLNTGKRDRFVKNAKGLYNGNEGPVKPVDLFNFAAAYNFSKKARLGLGIENIFNKTYYTVLSQYNANNTTYFRGPGTTASLNISYTF
nr:TonB-dependent receptor [Niabella beijingensis]